jgi:hypothetical protein
MACYVCDQCGVAFGRLAPATTCDECHEAEVEALAADSAKWRAIAPAVESYARAFEVFKGSVWGDDGDGPFRRILEAAVDVAKAALKAKGGG